MTRAAPACVRCGLSEAKHHLFSSKACHRFEPPAPAWLRALNAALEKVSR